MSAALYALVSRIDPRGQITDGIGVRCLGAAQALDTAGLLASPERDAAVAALPLPGDGCACIREQ